MKPVLEIVPLPAEPLLSIAEAALLLGLATQTLRNMRVKGLGPVATVLPSGRLRYRPSVIAAYMAAGDEAVPGDTTRTRVPSNLKHLTERNTA